MPLSRRDVAPLQLQRIDHQLAAGGAGLIDIGDVRQVAILDPRQMRGTTGGVTCLGQHREHRLAPILHMGDREYRLVMLVDRRDVVFAGDVLVRQDADDTGGLEHCRIVD